jgi:hypothetical protein
LADNWAHISFFGYLAVGDEHDQQHRNISYGFPDPECTKSGKFSAAIELDELIRVTQARNKLIGIEELTADELKSVRAELNARGDKPGT